MSNKLIEHKELFEEELKKVDKKILSLSDNRPFLIENLLQHLVSSGGKRLRPIYLILSSKLINGESNTNTINMAACVELLHTATLFHDDVVDGSKMRRGRKTANELWGNSASVLVGDFLLAQAFKIMSSTGIFEIIDVLSETSSIITEGEIKQLIHKTDITTTYDDYISIITSKTAELFSACCNVGAIVCDAVNEEKHKLSSFGRSLGIAFQIADDAIDYSSTAEKAGKTIGDDFREGKVTLPLIYTYQKSDESEKQYLESLFEGGEEARNDEELYNVLKLMGKYNAVEDSINEARNYQKKAIEDISSFEDSNVKQAMLDLLDFSVNRNF